MIKTLQYFVSDPSNPELSRSKAEAILTKTETLESILCRNNISFEMFCTIAERHNAAKSSEYAASAYLKLPRDQHGLVNENFVTSFVESMLRHIQRTVILSCLDNSGLGYFDEQRLMLLIEDAIRNLPAFEGMPGAFENFYLMVACKRFFFELDTKRTGKKYES